MKLIVVLITLLVASTAHAETLRSAVAAGVGISAPSRTAIRNLREAMSVGDQTCGGAGRFEAMQAGRRLASVAFSEPVALRALADAMDALQGICEAPTLVDRERVIRRLFTLERSR